MTDYAGIQIPQPGQSLQRARRAWRIYTDQHGRRFGAQAEMATNAPIGEFQPQGFNPPWLPTMRYAKFAQTGDLEFRWDYDAVAEDWSAQAASYYDEAIKLALQLPGDIRVPEVGGEVDRRIRAIAGPPPLSPAIPLACKAGDPWILGKPNAKDTLALKPVLLMTVGASGQEALKAIQARLDAQAKETGVEFIPSAPEKVLETERVRSITDVDHDAPMPVITYGAFMAEAKTRGMTHAEAAMAWKAHKENMAAEEVGV
ncbi:MAG TPA: hypothetical protein VF178_15710 [Gemmatimonadaceae bacterium]